MARRRKKIQTKPPQENKAVTSLLGVIEGLCPVHFGEGQINADQMTAQVSDIPDGRHEQDGWVVVFKDGKFVHATRADRMAAFVD